MRAFILPAKRVAKLEKNGGAALRQLETAAGVKVTVREKEGEFADVEVDGPTEAEWASEQVLRAIGLGFEPRHALKLLKDEFFLEQIDLEQAMHGNERGVMRQKARIIGTDGKAKKALEDLSEAKIAVGDDAIVGLLGGFEEVRAAKEAIIKLLEGRQHTSVYSYLENEKRKREARQMGVRI